MLARSAAQPRLIGARSRTAVTRGFILAVAVSTALLLTLFVDHVQTPLGWAVFAVSFVSIFTNLYQPLLFVRGWFLRRRGAYGMPRPTPVRGSAEGIAFIIASCNEPFEVAKMTFDCAYRAQYSGPREIIVVDNTPDTDDAEFLLWKAYVESHAGRDRTTRVVFRHNPDLAGKKPGNIDLAQKLIANSEYVVFLDVDSSLPLNADLLDRAVGRFQADPWLGVLQFHTVPTNSHFNRLSRAVAVSQHALRLSYLFRSRGGFSMFYGHNAMWRRSLLDVNGSWLEHYRDNVIVTEDLLKTLGVYKHGYTFEYLDVPTGEWVPSSLSALDSMWMRWTYGGLQVLFKYFRPIVTAPGLSFTQRFDLTAMLVGYVTTPLIAPLAFLWFAVFPAAQAAIVTAAVMWLPLVVCAGIMWRAHPGPEGLPVLKRLGDLYAGLFLVEAFILAVQTRAVANFFARKKQGWRVTAKCTEQKPRGLEILRNNRFMVALSGVAMLACVAGWGFCSGFSLSGLVDYSVLALIPAHLLTCVVVFGREVQGADSSVLAAVIDPEPLYADEIRTPVPMGADR